MHRHADSVSLLGRSEVVLPGSGATVSSETHFPVVLLECVNHRVVRSHVGNVIEQSRVDTDEGRILISGESGIARPSNPLGSV